MNALGGVIAVTNAAGSSELRLEKGTLKLAGGRVFADNLVMTNEASVVSVELGADYKPVTVTEGGAIKLGGSLVVSSADGFVPRGDYAIATGGTRTGRFASVDLPSGYGVRYTAGSAYITRGALLVIIR